MADWYLWFKVVHVVAVFAWMAGLFYLPRLFVYHVEVEPASEASRLFLTMERRLLKAIMNPAAAVSWVFGLLTAWSLGVLTTGTVWFWLKVGLVVCLTGFHVFLAGCHRDFARGRNRYSARFYRAVNEIPTLILVLVVILVVVKPFG